MNDWPKVNLGEVCQFIGGGTPSKKVPEYYNGTIPWVTVKDFKGHVISDTAEHITREAVQNSATRVVPEGTVLLVTRVSVGKVAAIKTAMAFNQDIKAVVPLEDRLDKTYLKWFFCARSAELERRATGATVKGITLSQLKDIHIPLPPLSEQRRIVELLSRADGIRRLRREGFVKARQLIPALFIEMFGDPATNPKGWPIVTFGELITYSKYGPRFPNRTYTPSGIHILRTTDMRDDGSINWMNSPLLALTEAELEKHRLSPRTLLITRSGTIGRLALFRGANEPCIAGAYLIEFGIKEDVNDEYVLSFFLTEHGKMALTRGSRTVTLANLNAPNIKAIRLPMPLIGLQDAFAEKVADIKALIAQQDRVAVAADELMASLTARF